MKLQLEPGDLLLFKLAGINPKSVLASKALEIIEEKLPHPWSSFYKEVRGLSTNLKDKVEKLFSSDENKPEEKKPEEIAKVVVTPTEIVDNLSPKELKDEIKTSAHNLLKKPSQGHINSDTDLTDAFKKSVPEIKKQDIPKNREGSRPEDYFTDDWDIPYGMSFTLMPPYIQI